MPTGYTAEIYEGKKPTFQEFAMGCARAFGACIMLRDEPTSTPIPEKFEASTYHVKALAEATENLLLLQGMTEEAKATGAELYNQRQRERYLESVEKHNRMLKDYSEMLMAAQSWAPPTPEHENFKAFMISQLKESMEFDCHTPEAPETVTPEVWFANQLKSANWSLAYHQKEDVKEKERTDGRNAWISDLRKSLDPLTPEGKFIVAEEGHDR